MEKERYQIDRAAERTTHNKGNQPTEKADCVSYMKVANRACLAGSGVAVSGKRANGRPNSAMFPLIVGPID